MLFVYLFADKIYFIEQECKTSVAEFQVKPMENYGQKQFFSLVVWILFVLKSKTEARGCYKDPKIYKVDLTIEKQMQLLRAAEIDCYIDIAKSTVKISGKHCNATFDNIMCWPDTKAGTTAVQHCPNYIHGFDTRSFARRECLSNGEWRVHPVYNQSWTDFTQCLWKEEEGSESILISHVPTITKLTIIGYSMSLACLLVAIVLMLLFRRLHCQRNTIHINLFVSFALRSVICLIKDILKPDGVTDIIENTAVFNSSGSNWDCKLTFSLFHYILIANYMWIFIEGLYLHSLIFISTFKKSKYFITYILFGWLAPLLPVIPWVVVRKYLEDTVCWNTHDPENKFDWIIRGPIVFTIVINFIFFINIIRVLFTKLTATNMNDPHRYRKLARSTLVLIPLFGVYYIVLVAMPDCMEADVELGWLYFESFVNAFQGLIVATLFCFLNGEVQSEVRKRWFRHTLRRPSNVSSRSTRTFSIGSTVYTKDRSQPSTMYNDNSKKDTLSKNGYLSVTQNGCDGVPRNGNMELIKMSRNGHMSCNTGQNDIAPMLKHDKDSDM